MELTEALVKVRKSRDPIDAVRDVLVEVRPQLDLEDEKDLNFLQSLFEAPFIETVTVTALAARESIFYHSLDRESTLLSAYNEYVSLMSLMERVRKSENTNFARPASELATEVADSNNPVGAAYAILRKNKKLSDKQVATIMEAALPIATNGLDEDTRDSLYFLASERGVTSVEVANAYVELAELVTAFRFMEPEES